MGCLLTLDGRGIFAIIRLKKAQQEIKFQKLIFSQPILKSKFTENAFVPIVKTQLKVDLSSVACFCIKVNQWQLRINV